VARHHENLCGLASERPHGFQIDLRLGLVVACEFCAQDRVPNDAVAAGERHHQRHVAVRNRCQEEALPQLGQGTRNIGPSIEAMPGQNELMPDLRTHGKTELAQHAVQAFPMQRVEVDPGSPARPDILHAGLVARPPGIRDRSAVETGMLAPEKTLDLSGDARAPVDERSENIEHERPDRHLSLLLGLSAAGRLAGHGDRIASEFHSRLDRLGQALRIMEASLFRICPEARGDVYWPAQSSSRFGEIWIRMHMSSTLASIAEGTAPLGTTIPRDGTFARFCRLSARGIVWSYASCLP
jgi:hypothetical protein